MQVCVGAQDFNNMLLQDWCNLISAVSDQKLKQPLMSQDPQGTVLRVNFDAALVRLLREVRYFLLLPDLPIEIPANALKVRLIPTVGCAAIAVLTLCTITSRSCMLVIIANMCSSTGKALSKLFMTSLLLTTPACRASQLLCRSQ